MKVTIIEKALEKEKEKDSISPEKKDVAVASVWN